MNKKKSVLFIAPVFHKYTDLIIESLTKQGLEVTFFENKMFKSDINCSTWIFYSLIKKINNPNEKSLYVKYILSQIKGKTFDILFAINGFSITKELINGITTLNPKIRKTIFYWDSLCYWKYSNTIKLFDYKWSFDHYDCQKFANLGLQYHPDFLTGIKQESEEPDSTFQYDIVHIGVVNIFSLNRIKYLSEIKAYCNENHIKHYIKLVYTDHNRLKKFSKSFILHYLTSRKYRKLISCYKRHYDNELFVDRPIPFDEVIRIENKAKIILDFPLDKQRGCTIRSLEALHRKQKLITSNSSIAEDSFYDPNNILIYNDEKSISIKEFMSKPLKDINMNDLTISNWCKSILNL